MTKHNNGGPAVEVPLVNGGVALVSPCDYERVMSYEWRLTTKGYVARRGGNSGSVLLHRFVLNSPPFLDVHHKNECKTDCRRENLDELSPKEHQRMHSHIVTARNIASRIYPLTGTCKTCGTEFVANPDHRGRQTCCSKRCACLAAVAARKEKQVQGLRR